ncbi:MAG: hypothetical protein K2X82_08255 [Gemmataceae bacterium]|nr:hypothetical protein [Gemmataceae bacterium]
MATTPTWTEFAAAGNARPWRPRGRPVAATPVRPRPTRGVPRHRQPAILRRLRRLRRAAYGDIVSALFTTTTSGNYSSGSTWVGGVAPSNGDRIVRAAGHTLTFDVSATVGDSRPNRQLILPTLASASATGFLPAGSYYAFYTQVDSGGGESAPSPEGVRLTGFTNSGSNVLRVTLPALPAGVASRNLYLTSGASGTGKLYATGITGTTYDCTSASWTDGTTTEAFAASAPAAWAIDASTTGDTVVASGVTLKVRGDVIRDSHLTLSGTAVWEWDASAAVSPSNTRYADYTGRAFTTTYKFRTTGTSSGTRATVRSNSGGGNGYFRTNVGPGSVGEYIGTANLDLSYVDFVRVGDATNDAIRVAPYSGAESNVHLLTGCTFDANCGSVFVANAPAAGGGYTVVDCEFNQTNCRQIAGAAVPTPLHPNGNSTTPSGSRLVQRCVFVKKPTGRGFGTSWKDNFFEDGWSAPGDSTQWAEFSGNFHRKTDANDQGTNGTISNGLFLYDPVKTTLTTGTVVSGTATTLTVSGTPWTSNAYQSSATADGCKTVVHKTAAGVEIQRRRILSNTTNTLTVSPNFSPTPVAGDTLEILTDGGNVHGYGAALVGTTCGLTGNMFLSTSCDADGDLWKSFGAANCVYTASGNVVGVNASRVDQVACLITMFNNTVGTCVLDVLHNTVVVGLQSSTQINEGGTNQTAGTLRAYKSNIAAALRASSEWGGGLQCYHVLDSSNSADPSVGTQDILAAGGASYNRGFNLRAGLATGGFHINCSVTPNTTGGSSGDPQFAAPTRSLDTWDASLGGPGTFAGAIARMKADRTLIAEARVFCRNGFRVHDASLKDAGHDGATIGAMEWVPTPLPYVPLPQPDRSPPAGIAY